MSKRQYGPRKQQFAQRVALGLPPQGLGFQPQGHNACPQGAGQGAATLEHGVTAQGPNTLP